MVYMKIIRLYSDDRKFKHCLKIDEFSTMNWQSTLLEHGVLLYSRTLTQVISYNI